MLILDARQLYQGDHETAIKLHTLLDVKCEIPCFIPLTDGLVHDVNVLDLPAEEYLKLAKAP